MTNYPEMTHTQAARFHAEEGEWSKAAQAAFEVLRILKAAKKDMIWCSAHQKTSQNVIDRWEGLKMWTDKMCAIAEGYSKELVRSIEKELEQKLRWLDEANVDFDALVDHPLLMLEDGLEQYAETIIEALKKEMDCDDWGDTIEADAFERERL